MPASRLPWASGKERTDPVIGEPVTRVLRWSGPEAVVRVKTRTELIVAIPATMPRQEVLDLAGLVLSPGEHLELRRKIAPSPPEGSDRPASYPYDPPRSQE